MEDTWDPWKVFVGSWNTCYNCDQYNQLYLVKYILREKMAKKFFTMPQRDSSVDKNDSTGGIKPECRKCSEYDAHYGTHKIEFKVIGIQFDRTAISPHFKKLTIATLSSFIGFCIDSCPQGFSIKWPEPWTF
jgi:hypothetical protein